MIPATSSRQARHRGSAVACRRRAFSLVEMLIALAITATLLTAVFVALDVSFRAYQKTTEEASTHTICRLTMHRMLTLIRTGRDFGPFPSNLTVNSVVESDFIEFYASNGQLMRLEYVPDDKALYLVKINGGEEESSLLLEGVTQLDGENNYVSPFTLEYRKGTQLYRATIDLTIVPDDNLSLSLEGDEPINIRLVASAIPRGQAY